MSLLTEIRPACGRLSSPDLLRYLIKERFPGKTVVTAALRAPSIVVLKMIADIDPATPVVFCRSGHLFPKSGKYREAIVKQLKLSNVGETTGHETVVAAGDQDHCERMWSENEYGPGRSYEIVHLNQSLAPYDCWISAVYHMAEYESGCDRVDVEGRLVRVNPLAAWTREEMHRFMIEHGLPFHPRAFRRTKLRPWPKGIPIPPTYHF